MQRTETQIHRLREGLQGDTHGQEHVVGARARGQVTKNSSGKLRALGFTVGLPELTRGL